MSGSGSHLQSLEDVSQQHALMPNSSPLDIRDTLNEILGQLAIMKDNIATMKDDVANMEGDVTILKHDVAALKTR